MIHAVLTEKRMRAFLEELAHLQAKHDIPAMTGQVFSNGVGAPFKSFADGGIILLSDKDRTDQMYNRICSLNENGTGVKSITITK